MKGIIRSVTFLSLMLIMILGSGFSTLWSTTAGQNDVDPACVSECTLLMQHCFATQGQHDGQRACIAVYRHCVAQCGKH